MRRIMSKVARSETFHLLVAWLVKQYIKLVFYTSKWSIVGIDIPEKFIQEKKPFVACFWHGRLAMIPKMWQWKEPPMTALVSAHQDGLLVGKVFKLFGVNYITGSTNRKGSQALRQTIRILKEGNPIGMTPDGPRGPREVVYPGIVTMARLGGASMIPVSYSVKRYRLLNTWDRFMLPLPFNRGVFLWGEPITVSPDATEEDMEKARLSLEKALITMQQQADAAFLTIN